MNKTHVENFPVLYSEEEISAEIATLAKKIAQDYPSDEDIVFLIVLKGSMLFGSQLITALWKEGIRQTVLDVMRVKSYSGTESTRAPKLALDTVIDIADKHVLIVEDIIDTGHTLAFLREQLEPRGPKTLRTAVLLDKPSKREVEATAEYVGFTIEDKWVEGFGFDYDDYNRGCPYIYERV